MNLTILKGQYEIKKFEPVYRSFAKRYVNSEPHPFYHPDWFYKWNRHLSLEREPVFLLVWQKQQLVALIPFTECPAIGGKGLWPAGYHTADRFDPWIGEDKKTVIPFIIEGYKKLLKDYQFVWMPLQSKSMSDYLDKNKLLIGRFFLKNPWCRNYLIDLQSNDYDGYLEKTFKPKTRQTLRRQKRKLEEAGLVKYSIIENGKEAGSAMDEMLKIEHLSWKGNAQVGLFSRQMVKEFYEELLPIWLDSGKVRIYLLGIEQETIAYLLAFCWKNTVGMHNLAFHPKWAHFSPGKLLLHHVIEDCFHRKVNCFDFLQGNSSFKKHFANQYFDLIDWNFFRASVWGICNYYSVKFLSRISRKKLEP